jgi:type IV pilus assembly protein PilB
MHIERASNKHLGELLVERGVISRAQVEKTLEYQHAHPGVLFGEALVAIGLASEEDIAQALTCQYGFPYLPLLNYEIDPDVIRAVPANLCEQFCLIPIDKIGKSLTLAMANPLNVKAVDDVELITGCTVQAFVSTTTDIRNAIKKYYGLA